MGRILSKGRFGRHCACLKRGMELVIRRACNLDWALPNLRPNLPGKCNFLVTRLGRYATKSDRLLRCRKMTRRANGDTWQRRKKCHIRSLASPTTAAQ
jgi:hypothetical protein